MKVNVQELEQRVERETRRAVQAHFAPVQKSIASELARLTAEISAPRSVGPVRVDPTAARLAALEAKVAEQQAQLAAKAGAPDRDGKHAQQLASVIARAVGAGPQREFVPISEAIQFPQPTSTQKGAQPADARDNAFPAGCGMIVDAIRARSRGVERPVAQPADDRAARAAAAGIIGAS